MKTCYHCGRMIRGSVTVSQPPRYLVDLGLDFGKAFHPGCWEKAEREATKELQQEERGTA